VVLLMMAILTGVRWNLSVVLICISLKRTLKHGKSKTQRNVSQMTRFHFNCGEMWELNDAPSPICPYLNSQNCDCVDLCGRMDCAYVLIKCLEMCRLSRLSGWVTWVSITVRWGVGCQRRGRRCEDRSQ
jgi:hypothetical protein